VQHNDIYKRHCPHAFEHLLRAKSFEQVIEVQSQYARMAYEAYVAELTKLGEMYAGLTRATPTSRSSKPPPRLVRLIDFAADRVLGLTPSRLAPDK
jgi:Phasin protein